MDQDKVAKMYSELRRESMVIFYLSSKAILKLHFSLSSFFNFFFPQKYVWIFTLEDKNIINNEF